MSPIKDGDGDRARPAGGAPDGASPFQAAAQDGSADRRSSRLVGAAHVLHRAPRADAPDRHAALPEPRRARHTGRQPRLARGHRAAARRHRRRRAVLAGARQAPGDILVHLRESGRGGGAGRLPRRGARAAHEHAGEGGALARHHRLLVHLSRVPDDFLARGGGVRAHRGVSEVRGDVRGDPRSAALEHPRSHEHQRLPAPALAGGARRRRCADRRVRVLAHHARRQRRSGRSQAQGAGGCATSSSSSI